MPNNADKLPKLYSEELNEILGNPPKGIILRGMTLLLFILLLLLLICYFIKYPEVINCEIEITTTNLTSNIVVQPNTKLQVICVKDKDTVTDNQILAIIENSADSKDILELYENLKLLKNNININDTSTIISFNDSPNLGELQSVYFSFLKDYFVYMNFLKEKNKIFQNKENIFELKIQQQIQKNELYGELLTSFDKLQEKFNKWKRDYLLVSPIKGTVTFFKQNCQTNNVYINGDTVFYILPIDKIKICGKIILQPASTGKLKLNQKINTKLDIYPYMEYGMLNSKVSSMSFIPDENIYIIETLFPDTLITNYGKKINCINKMHGKAEIITDDLSLLDRFFLPIKHIVYKNKD